MSRYRDDDDFDDDDDDFDDRPRRRRLLCPYSDSDRPPAVEKISVTGRVLFGVLLALLLTGLLLKEKWLECCDYGGRLER